MVNVTVLGGPGLVGKELLNHGMERGLQITVLARDPNKLGSLQERVTVVEGDYFDHGKLAEALTGARAVISTIGPKPQASSDQTKALFVSSMNSMFEVMSNKSERNICRAGGLPCRAQG